MKDIYNICRKYFASNDMRFTAQRKVMLDQIFQMNEHFSAENLFENMAGNDMNISRTTVYRSLPVFEESGIINQVMQDNKTTYYELAYKRKHHDHLICERCNEVIEFSNNEVEKIQKRIYKKYNFLPTEHQMILKGICSKCRKINDE